ncbi:hypothetical protein AJ85_13740 [Alkalihalobacillus alcalophilus ATCC 27647 = CGMCC 1.3604]|uniref:Uncharacterized protein n=1 Tax=Alkalihalobacillus alcalophilus ATCC 27647 = CGMCC 1.3604 TaxID=1218173 RepID=A0A4S4K3G3_ALKAL|nr:hypothetical protein AJ85_13740 [Alkalihalobacillus alcalophilus ATCC 27647 = CGMCC 1.3604]
MKKGVKSHFFLMNEVFYRNIKRKLALFYITKQALFVTTEI